MPSILLVETAVCTLSKYTATLKNLAASQYYCSDISIKLEDILGALKVEKTRNQPMMIQTHSGTQSSLF